MPSGDIRVTGASPHDYNLLRQEWPDHQIHGKVTPMLPEEKSIDQPVLVLGLPIAITNEEIESHLAEEDLFPKKIERFNKKGSTEQGRIHGNPVADGWA